VFEVWMAEPDGSGARQVSHDGIDAENPVATPDGEWIVYASANPRTRGLMKVRPNGKDTTVVLAGNLIEPEVSPDGKNVAFVADAGSPRPFLRVVSLADGAPVMEVALPPWSIGGGIDQGRCRWLPDGRGLVYVVRDQDGYSVYSRLLPAFDAAGASRRVASLSPDLDAESLGVSPDGSRLTVSFREQRFDLMIAEGLDGVGRGRRAP
jgi:Tol biopolymer transport system component